MEVPGLRCGCDCRSCWGRPVLARGGCTVAPILSGLL